MKAEVRSYGAVRPLDCLVTDISADGAKLVFPPGCEPPDAFDLFVPARGDTRHALVRWSTSNVVGVEFVEKRSTEYPGQLGAVLARLQLLENEMRGVVGGEKPIFTNEAERPIAAVLEAGDGADGLTRRLAAVETRTDEILSAMQQMLVLLDRLRRRGNARPAP